jgi:hypothetical protein
MTGMTPQEFLHLTGNGMFRHLLEAVRDVIGPKDSNARAKGVINKCFADIKFLLEHNSERDVSRMSNRKGFFNVASLTSEEVRGNFFGMVILMHTTFGEKHFKPCFDKLGINFKEARETCLLMLAWERFYLDPQTRRDVEASYEATQRLQKRIKKLLPREDKDTKKETGLALGVGKFPSFI